MQPGWCVWSPVRPARLHQPLAAVPFRAILAMHRLYRPLEPEESRLWELAGEPRTPRPVAFLPETEREGAAERSSKVVVMGGPVTTTTLRSPPPSTTESSRFEPQRHAESTSAELGSASGVEPEFCCSRARLEYEQGRFEDAVRSCRSLLELKPTHVATRFILGRSLERLQRCSEAEKEYRRAIELDPQFRAARIARGFCLLRLDQPGEALVEFDQCLIHEPDQAAAMIGKAAALQALGLEGAARNLLQVVARQHPDLDTRAGERAAQERGLAPVPAAPSSTPIESLADSAFSRSDFAAAADLCRQILRREPARADAWLNLAIALIHTVRLDEAEEAIRHLLEVESDRAQAHVLAGLALRARGEGQAAASCCERALGLRPDCEEALWNLALLREELGEFDKARQVYERLAANGPEHGDLWFRMGTVRFRLGDYAASAEAFEACRGEEGLSAATAYNAGLAWWRARDLTRARQCFDKLVDLQPDCVSALSAAASVALECGDDQQAAQLFKRLAVTGTASPGVCYCLALLREYGGDPAEAATWYGRALAMEVDLADALVSLGILYEQQGEPHLARGFFQNAVRLRNGSSSGRQSHRDSDLAP